MKRMRLGDRSARKVYDKTGGVCYYCGTELHYEDKLDWSGKVATTVRIWVIDHKQPLSRGGTDSMDNFVPACKTCNDVKGKMTVEEFMDTPYLQRKLGWQS